MEAQKLTLGKKLGVRCVVSLSSPWYAPLMKARLLWATSYIQQRLNRLIGCNKIYLITIFLQTEKIW